MSSISEVDFTNAKNSSDFLAKEYLPSGENSLEYVDFKQAWRLHLLDMLSPYCEHDKGLLKKSDMGRNASRLWNKIMTECAEWEVEQGL